MPVKKGKLSYKDQRDYDLLPSRIEQLEGDMVKLGQLWPIRRFTPAIQSGLPSSPPGWTRPAPKRMPPRNAGWNWRKWWKAETALDQGRQVQAWPASWQAVIIRHPFQRQFQHQLAAARGPGQRLFGIDQRLPAQTTRHSTSPSPLPAASSAPSKRAFAAI
jgi:hypothetical protein